MDAFHDIAEPRPDVARGETDDSVYAASLGDLLHRSEAGRRYWDGDEFDRLTYKTDGLRQSLDDIRLRLQEGRGNGFRQIETAFGGGKTHSMIAMFHECRKWGADAIVIDGGRLNASKDTIWGEMERQLDGERRNMDVIAPSEDEIRELLQGRAKPTLILMDEILPYVESAAGVVVGDTNMAVQTNTFMQRLSNAVKTLPGVCVVLSLPDEENAQEKKLYDHLKSVAGRQRQLITVATESDMPHILRRRLFVTEESVIQDRARGNIQSYVERCVGGKSIEPDNEDGYIDDFTSTYPFTPDVLDVLFNRWATYPTFQKTRGALRLLSTIIHSLLESDRTEITLADINLEVPAIREELVKHAGENMKGIISADITGRHAGAKQFKEVGVRCAGTIFMYSFPRECKGATQAEMKRAVSTDVISHSEAGDALGGLQRVLFHLDLTNDDMYRFSTKENINRIIERAKSNVNSKDVEAEEHRRLKATATGGGFVHVEVWPNHTTRIEDRPAIQLIILDKNDPERCKDMVNNVSQKQGRANSNALAFLLPTNGGKLGENIRRLLAMRRIRETHGDMLKSNPTNDRRVGAEESEAENYIPHGLREKYAEVWLPDKEEVARRLDTMMAHTRYDDTSIGKIVWDYMVKAGEAHETFTQHMLDTEYGGEPDGAFRKMMTTPGERRPASLDVLQNATKPREPEVEEPRVVSGPKFIGEDDGGEIPLEPEIPTPPPNWLESGVTVS